MGDEIIQKLREAKDSSISVSKPEIEALKLKLDAVSKLADPKNQIFSQLSEREIMQVSAALVFARNPLPNLNKRLKEKGIAPIVLTVLEDFVFEIIVHRMKLDRQRVREYIDGLNTAMAQNNSIPEKPPGQGVYGRLI